MPLNIFKLFSIIGTLLSHVYNSFKERRETHNILWDRKRRARCSKPKCDAVMEMSNSNIGGMYSVCLKCTKCGTTDHIPRHGIESIKKEVNKIWQLSK